MTDDDREFFENERLFQERKQKQFKGQDNYAKNKIKKTIKTSITTAVIGSLADYEAAFGSLWGHGKKWEELSDEQKTWREIWLDVRDSILERGANSNKLSLQEIDRCKIADYSDKRYHVEIRNKDDRDGR